MKNSIRPRFALLKEEVPLSATLQEIGNVVRDERGKKRLSMNRSAKMIGCPYGLVRRIETGESVELTTFFKVTDYYDISFELHYQAPLLEKLKSRVRRKVLKNKEISLTSALALLQKIICSKRKSDGFVPAKKDPEQQALARLVNAPRARVKDLLLVLAASGIWMEMVVVQDMNGSPPSKPSLLKAPAISKEKNPATSIRLFDNWVSIEHVLQQIGQTVKGFRDNSGKTLQEVAKESGVSFGTLQRCEKGAQLALGGLLETLRAYGSRIELYYARLDAAGSKKWESQVIEPKNDLLAVVGNIFENARLAKKMTQTALDQTFGETRSELSRLENGTTNIRAKRFIRLLRMLEIDLILLLPKPDKVRPYDKIGAPFPNFTSRHSDRVQRLLTGDNPLETLLTTIGTIVREVRLDRAQSLRSSQNVVGFDNSRIGKIEKGLIDMRTDSFVDLFRSIGVTVDVVYPAKSTRRKSFIAPATETTPIEFKHYDLTRSRLATMRAIGRIVRWVRKESSKSLRDLEREIGMDNSKLGKLEKGQFKPRLSTLGGILLSLGITLEVRYRLTEPS